MENKEEKEEKKLPKYGISEIDFMLYQIQVDQEEGKKVEDVAIVEMTSFIMMLSFISLLNATVKDEEIGQITAKALIKIQEALSKMEKEETEKEETPKDTDDLET
jgi:hypothetical protein